MIQECLDLNTSTQLADVRRHLEKGGTLTPLEAWRLFGCSRLAARIHTLRLQGVAITTRIITVPTSSGRAARIAEYRLSERE